jgi:hypothetical protein
MRTNPITQRLGQLSDQWARFAANDAARVLLWQLTAAEVRMLDAFVELESDERTAEHATLFMTLDSPFEGAAAHGRSLAEKLWEGMIQGSPSCASSACLLAGDCPRLSTKSATRPTWCAAAWRF